MVKLTNLDVYKFLVHDVGSCLTLEALPLHDVAPVTGAVPDTQEDHLLLSPGLLDGLLAPGVPVHRICLMLE